jgi:MOSC domain-containing protein YiiM
MNARIVAVCTSLSKGGQKKPVNQVELVEGFGIKGDAHAGDWHRQVSLLAQEKIDEMRDQGLDLEPGAFGENLVCSGFELEAVQVGSRIRIDDGIELEVTQLGKECHTPCAIFYQVGSCIMPQFGVFARVLKGGVVEPGAPIAMA